MKFKVLAGDFGKTTGGIGILNGMYIEERDKWGNLKRLNTIGKSQIESLDIATEENMVKVGGAAGWGVAGGLLLGPVGLLAGAVLGGHGKKTTFIMVMEDGKKLIGQCSSKNYAKILAYVF